MSTLQIFGLLAYGIFLVSAFRYTDLVHFANNKRQQHLVFGAAASLFVLWLFKAGIFDGLDVHFLGLTVVTLMLASGYFITHRFFRCLSRWLWKLGQLWRCWLVRKYFTHFHNLPILYTVFSPYSKATFRVYIRVRIFSSGTIHCTEDHLFRYVLLRRWYLYLGCYFR